MLKYTRLRDMPKELRDSVRAYLDELGNGAPPGKENYRYREEKATQCL